ncbi:hypothetical protein KIK06_23800 [Nocardiopsis sp. EMB25]|uniref:hypothetical protein n=1 Tax=Nocardiopsis sp. EMB25 TaxID=2835867 RepID=UPI00228409AC|nr:hypothetical protein [Nocardiopsis sp. EMB25]MCY9786912.1 hypothetical protein [Nocardiopsis sp. EMB25]
MTPEIEAAHRVLREVFVHGRQATDFPQDSAIAGYALLGVLSAFFRNVMERPFTGHEDEKEIKNHLAALKRSYPSEMDKVKPKRMAQVVLDQIGPGAPPPGRFRLPMDSGLVHQMRLVAEYTARDEGIVGKELEMYLDGACARYYTGGY